MKKTIIVLILIAFAFTLILMMPNPTKALSPAVSIINPGPTSKPTKWTAAPPRAAEIGTTNFNFYSPNETAVGQTFFINATINDVTAINAWGTGVLYDNTTLDYVSAWRPTDHVFAPAQALGIDMVAPAVVVADIDATHKEVQWGCSFIEPDTGETFTFNGTGTMCQIQFRIIGDVNQTNPLRSASITYDPNWTDAYIWPAGQTTLSFGTGTVNIIYSIVPEFTATILLSMFAIASLVAVIAKNRHKKALAT